MHTKLVSGNTLEYERDMSAAEVKRITGLLWSVQGLLAALFLFAGIMKLVLPIAEIARQSGLPGPFLRFIALAEILGTIGLIVPVSLRIRPILTPLAATGLLIIMIGATVISAPAGAVAFFPMVIGGLATFIAYGRFRMVPCQPRGSRK